MPRGNFVVEFNVIARLLMKIFLLVNGYLGNRQKLYEDLFLICVTKERYSSVPCAFYVDDYQAYTE